MFWYTRAIRDNNRSVFIHGGPIWRCPECGYDHGVCPLPHKTCGNCGLALEVDGPGDGVTKVPVKKTRYGFEYDSRRKDDILWSDRMNAIRALPITF